MGWCTIASLKRLTDVMPMELYMNIIGRGVFLEGRRNV
jgi:hypothetical protein